MIYLLHYNLDPTTAGSACMNAQEREKEERRVRKAKKRKGIEAHRVKPPTPSQTTDAHIGDEEKNEERNRERVPNPATPDYVVASYEPHDSYGEPIII